MSVEVSPDFIQASSYSAEQLRRGINAPFQRIANGIGTMQGGIVGSGDLALTAPGSGLSVNVAAGECYVPGSTSFASTPSGYYLRNTASLNVTIGTANPSNPRIDTVCATINDAAYHGALNSGVIQVVAGTATSGATLTNLSGAASLPDASLLLGYVLVPAAASNIITADILSAAAFKTSPMLYLGSNIFNARGVSGSGTVTAVSGDHILVSSGNTPITLPAPFPNARVKVTNYGGGSPILSQHASEVIYCLSGGTSGLSSVTIGAYGGTWEVQSDGTSWYTTASNTDALVASGYATSTGGAVPSSSYAAAGWSPAVTLVCGTRVRINFSASMQNNTGGDATYVAVAISGANTAAATDSVSINFIAAVGNYTGQYGRTYEVGGMTPGSTTFTLESRSPSGAGAIGNCDIGVQRIA